MTEEPKKISFGFSKVSKKNSVIQPKKNEPKSDIQYIDCLEEKSIKLASGEEEEKKELPIIPMRNGNLLRENIKEVAKSRGRIKEGLENNSDLSSNIEHNLVKKVPLTLDELATKEILEGLNKCKDEEPVKETLTVPVGDQITYSNTEQSTFEDYENMPISDFGLAMLRGMGWNPKKGIGLNEKLVTPLAPSLRPKGMGLGADKIPSVQNVTSNGELLIMKKGAPVKIVSGPHNNLFGKIEGFDELPGRLMVRLASNNTVVSLNELMVQLVSTTEFSKNVHNSEVKSVEIESNDHGLHKHNVKAENYGLIYNKHRRDEKYKEMKENGSVEKKKEKYERTNKKTLNSDSDEMDNEAYKQNQSKERHRSDSSSERSSSYKTSKVSREGKKYKSKSKDKYYKEDYKRHSKHRSKYTDSESTRSNKKSSRRRKHRSNSSSDSDSDGKRTKKSSNYDSDSFKKVSHSRNYRKQYKN